MYTESTKKEVIDFYNKESENYSRKRYEGQILTYTQFMFRRRFSIALSYIERLVNKDNKINIFEMACADGVLLRKIFLTFPGSISRSVGMDISDSMVLKARELSLGFDNMSYFVKDEIDPGLFDVILGLGYVSTPIIHEEFLYVNQHLVKGGYYICSLPGRLSLQARIKLRDKEYAKSYLTYEEYEKIILNYFEIVSSDVYGFFVPKLWAIPFLARSLQPIVEVFFKRFSPNLYHEKIYLLRKR